MSRSSMEIACDESGSEGEKLIGTTTDVFAHASVRLDVESAERCLRDLRDRAPTVAVEYKAYRILRERNRPVLAWLLGPSGPLLGNAHVHLTDKAYFVVGRVVELLVDEVAPPADTGRRGREAMAATLYREGRRAFGGERWEAFLLAANDLMRARNRQGVGSSVDSFFRIVEAMHRNAPSGVADVLGRLLRSRPHAESFRARLLEGPATVPALDPLIPAIGRAVAHWSDGGRPVSVVHDRQNTLSRERIAHLMDVLGPPNPACLGGLAGLSLVDSRSDARVQVADVLAGAARKIASDELNDRGDAQLTALLRPYVDAFSVWGDDRSWSRLHDHVPAPSEAAGEDHRTGRACMP